MFWFQFFVWTEPLSLMPNVSAMATDQTWLLAGEGQGRKRKHPPSFDVAATATATITTTTRDRVMCGSYEGVSADY